MTAFATYGGNACTVGRVQIPGYGRGWIDVEISEPVVLTGLQTFALGAFTAVTTVVSGGIAEGKARYSAVFGHGGWGRTLDEKSYINDAGVKASNVLQDAAVACGEVMGTTSTRRLGAHYARAAGPASEALHVLAPRGWRVDLAGATQINAWSAATYAGDGARLRTDLSIGVIELAVDEIGNLLPGVTVDGHGPATDVEYQFDAKRLVVRVYFGGTANPRVEAIRDIVAACFPQLRYAGTFEFRVVTQESERFNLQPVRTSHGFDDLRNVPTRGMSGQKADVTPGEIVLVSFADNDPSRPKIIAHDEPDSPAWRPTLVKFGDGGDFVALKSSLDALQQAFDLHTHPHAVGPTATPTTPVGPLASSVLVKVD